MSSMNFLILILFVVLAGRIRWQCRGIQDVLPTQAGRNTRQQTADESSPLRGSGINTTPPC